MIVEYRFLKAKPGGYWVLTRDRTMEREEKWEDGQIVGTEYTEVWSAERTIGRVERVPLGRRWTAYGPTTMGTFTTRKAAAEALEAAR